MLRGVVIRGGGGDGAAAVVKLATRHPLEATLPRAKRRGCRNRRGFFPSFLVLSCCVRGGFAQYDSCTNGTVADIGNGRCDAALNNPSCGFDGGDCCHCTCTDGPVHSCPDNVFHCIFPDCGDPTTTSSREDGLCTHDWIGDGWCDDVNNSPICGYDGGDCCSCSCVDGEYGRCGYFDFVCRDPTCYSERVAEFPGCTGDWRLIGDGSCNAETNLAVCGWDGGDCCPCTCLGWVCNSLEDSDCLDPMAGDEVYDCKPPPPAALPCSPEVQRTWVVEDSAGARTLAAAVNCSGGSFEVEWRGEVVIDAPIYVVDGTVLTVTGGEPVAAINGNASTRLFTVVNATLRVVGVNITSGSGFVGGAIAAFGSTLSLIRTVLIGNHASGDGGAVYASEGSNMSCDGVSFINNRADAHGGAVHVAAASIVSCGGSWLNNSAAGEGGALLVRDASNFSWGEQAMFAQNTAGIYGGALVVIHGSSVSWDARTSFQANEARVDGGAFIVEAGSSVSWNASTAFLDNEAGGMGGAIAATDGSSLSWGGASESRFVGNRASHDGGAVVLLFSHLSCTEETNTSFTNNSTPGLGGALHLGGSSAFFGGVTAFIGNSATGDAYVYESGAGGALFVSEGSSVSWGRDLDFIGNAAEKVAGALYVSDSSASWLERTRFVGNKADFSGGAILLWNGSHVEWTGDTQFLSNEAQADGGAVASPAFNSEYNLKSSTLAVNGSTTFANNTSGANGGALALSEGLLASIAADNVSFVGNSAKNAGGAVFVAGMGFGPAFTGVSFVSNSAHVGGAVSTVGAGNLKGFADVESPNPTTFDRCRFVGNRATTTGGAVESAAGQDYMVDSMFEGNTAGAGGALRLAGMASIVNCSFVENVSDDGGGAAVSNIGSIPRMANVSFNDNTLLCPPNMFLDYLPGDPFEVFCGGCQTTCESCFYENPTLAPTCVGVLDHSNSPGGNVTLATLSIESGYWRATTSSQNVRPCYNFDACLGGVTGAAGYCQVGYEGPYCSVCSKGYMAQLGFTCSKCSDRTSGLVFVALVAVMAMIAGGVLVWYMMSGEVRDRERERGPFGRLFETIPLQSVKVVIVAWQILTQFAAVANVTYPDVYQRFLDRLDVFNFDFTWILSAGCVVDIDFHDRLLASTIPPLVALVFMAGTYGAAVRINRGEPEALQTIWNKHVSMVLLLTFFVYSSVSSVLFSAYACEELEDGNVYLRADYRIRCDSSEHKAYEAYAGIMIVLYTVGIPALYGYLLFRHRKVLTKDRAAREQCPNVTKISALWKPYKPSAFYYELVECCRRILLASVVVFIEPNTSAQIAVTLAMAFVFVVISEALAPYASRWDTWLSRTGHAVVFASMYVALLLKVDVSDEGARNQRIFEAILVGAHFCMISVVVVETAVLTCSLNAEQRARCALRFYGSTGVALRRPTGWAAREDNPFASYVY